MDGEWWRGATKDGARGYFPKSYVELLGTRWLSRRLCFSYRFHITSHTPAGDCCLCFCITRARRFAARLGSGPSEELYTTEKPPLARALYAFAAKSAKELSFNAK